MHTHSFCSGLKYDRNLWRGKELITGLKCVSLFFFFEETKDIFYTTCGHFSLLYGWTFWNLVFGNWLAFEVGLKWPFKKLQLVAPTAGAEKNKPVGNDFMEQILGGIKTTGLNNSSLTQSKDFFPSKGNLFVGQVIGNTHCNFLKVFHRSFLWRLQTGTWNINIKEAQRKMKHVTNWMLSLELLKSLIPHHPLP